MAIGLLGVRTLRLLCRMWRVRYSQSTRVILVVPLEKTLEGIPVTLLTYDYPLCTESSIWVNTVILIKYPSIQHLISNFSDFTRFGVIHHAPRTPLLKPFQQLQPTNKPLKNSVQKTTPEIEAPTHQRRSKIHRQQLWRPEAGW